jgi:hypothetical protein
MVLTTEMFNTLDVIVVGVYLISLSDPYKLVDISLKERSELVAVDRYVDDVASILVLSSDVLLVSVTVLR